MVAYSQNFGVDDRYIQIILRYTGWTRNEGDSSMEFASVPNDPQILLKSLRCQ